MTKQAYLPDFPLTVFANSKRRFQAAIRVSRNLVIRHSLSGYAVLFEDILPGQFLDSIDPTQRQRSFGHLPVFWAWLAQMFEANASCSRAVSLIQSWCQTSQLPIPASSSSSYCQARQRIDASFLENIHTRIIGKLRTNSHPREQWKGLNLKAIDGTSFQLLDTPENQDAYPQPCTQKPGAGQPTMGAVGLLDLSHGGWENIELCRHTEHDSKVAAPLIDHLEQGDLLLADRAFCSYELIARTLERNCEVLMRLQQSRAKALDWRKGKKISPNERIVVWKRPQYRTKSSLSKEQWKELPESLTLRLIRFGYENREANKSRMILVTSLLDRQTHSGYELADLYHRRWYIELKLRDFKTTMGMESLAVKSPEMARKHLQMGIIAFNLIRSVMQKAASCAEKPTSQISFKGVIDQLTANHESFRSKAGRPRKRAEAMKQFISICAQQLIDIRPFRREPRARKRRPKNYQLLTTHRSQFQEITHRNRYRKTA